MAGRKLALVPYRVLEDLKHFRDHHEARPRLPPDPNLSEAVRLNREMSRIFEDDTLTETEKFKKHGEALRQYQMYVNKVKSGEEKPIPPKIEPVEEEEEVKTDAIERGVLESVPKTMQKKAKLLLSLVKNHPYMKWDAKGQLLIHDKPMPGTNMIDLINDALRHRKHFEPTGWTAFAKGLGDVNVPQDIVGNVKRWNWIQKQKTHTPFTSSPEEEEFATADSSSKKRKLTVAERIKQTPKRLFVTPTSTKKEVTPRFWTTVKSKKKPKKKKRFDDMWQTYSG